MWRFPVWKRTIVMAAGSITHFILGIVLLWIAVVVRRPARTRSGEKFRSADDATINASAPYVAVAALRAGGGRRDELRPGDRRRRHRPASQPATRSPRSNGTAVARLRRPGRAPSATPRRSSATVTFVHDGQARTTNRSRWRRSSARRSTTRRARRSTRSRIGRQPEPAGERAAERHVRPGRRRRPRPDALTGSTFTGIVHGAQAAPGEGPGPVARAHRPASATRTARSAWSAPAGSAARPSQHGRGADLPAARSPALNFFVGIFNLLPLLPLDGGHIAIAWFEKVRSWLYARLRRPDPGRVDYMKLMPITYAVILIFGGVHAADDHRRHRQPDHPLAVRVISL